MGQCASQDDLYGGRTGDVQLERESVLHSPHDGGVLGLCSVNENVFVSCSDDGTLRRGDWGDTSSTEDWMAFKGHKKAVNRVAVSEDMVYSASRDLSVRQWRLSTGECVHVQEAAHGLNISGIDVASGGRRVASGSRDYSVKVWDTESWTCMFEAKRSRNIVTCLKFHPEDPNLVFQGAEDLAVRVWDMRSSSCSSGQPCANLVGFVYFPLAMDVHASGSFVATGCKGFDNLGADVKVWDLRATKGGTQGNVKVESATAPHFSYSGHGMDASSVKFIARDTILSAGKDGSVMVSNPLLDQNRLLPGALARNVMSVSVAPTSVHGSPAEACFATVGHLDTGALSRVQVHPSKAFEEGIADSEVVGVISTLAGRQGGVDVAF